MIICAFIGKVANVSYNREYVVFNPERVRLRYLIRAKHEIKKN
jgi:hypothetical protein